MTLFDPNDYYVQSFDSWQPENLEPFLSEDLASDDDLQDWYQTPDGRLGYPNPAGDTTERGVS